MAAHSPASSPRLPSPPPIAEDQVGPTSPGISLYEDHGKLQTPIDSNAAASRRIRPGTKAEDMAEGPPLVDLQDLDSPFQLTEHLKALHYSYTHPADSSAVQPITASIAHDLAQPPPHTASEIWLYELGRFLIQKTNQIIVGLFADTPACSAQICPEMRASEWQYLCAVHDPPKSCSAIDYCCHTLDWAATTLTSSKMFPSRLGLGSSPSSSLSSAGTAAALTTDKVLASQMKEITNIFRRVYRIYAHAWFQHREMFWRVEGKTGLYVLFKTVCDEYGLIQPENYTIPPEAEGQEPGETEESGGGFRPQQQHQQLQTPMLLKRDMGAEGFGNDAGVDTTKRHRHTLSDRSSSVTTVIQEEVEEEDEHPTTATTTTMTTTEGPEEQDEKSLERQATSLKDFAESLPQPQQPHQDEEAEVKVEDDAPNPEDSGPVNTEDPTATQPPTVKEEEIGEEDEPVPGIERSETIKPSKEEGGEEEGESPAEVKTEEQQVEPGKNSETAPPAAGAATVVEAEEKTSQDQKLEPMEPSEAQAAEESEAGKTVAD
ncbi:Mob1/phocein [Hortaea werneckii]|nr:Mob1/phocein [Hortaea werneckii]KAI7097361.1 Mob1/phocein [Hortaea werneckii]KAI7238268.1 Mob1/phocein [Hortaea werneckii]KAI7301956.1 Mob1/phocein [Hortaea werneckii]KAI7389906.1 Mob1/phocein [Hortaea werneckii]